MRTKKNYLLIVILGVATLFYSCVKELDFDQLDQTVIAPVVEADFVYSTFDISNYIPGGLPPNTPFTIPPAELQDVVNYDLVGSDFATENLERIELVIEVRNTIEVAFVLQFQFLSETGAQIGQPINVTVNPGQGIGTNPEISYQDEFPEPIVLDPAELVNAQQVASEIIVTSPLNTDLRGVIDIRSKASYYINYPL